MQKKWEQRCVVPYYEHVYPHSLPDDAPDAEVADLGHEQQAAHRHNCGDDHNLAAALKVHRRVFQRRDFSADKHNFRGRHGRLCGVHRQELDKTDTHLPRNFARPHCFSDFILCV